MAKKKTSDKVQPPAITQPLDVDMFGDLGVDKEDVVAVAAVAREDQLEAEQDITKIYMDEASEELKKLNLEISAAATATANKLFVPECKKLVKSLSDANYNIRGFNISAAIVDNAKKPSVNKLQITVALTEHRDGNYYDLRSGAPRKVVLVPLPAAIKKLITRTDNLTKQLLALKKRSIMIATEQKKIPAIERKARAQLARSALSGTVQGRKILAQIDGIKAKKLPALPPIKG